MKRKWFKVLFAVVATVVLSAGILTGCGAKSAYQIALDNGFSGTESEWLQTIKGKSAYELACENGFNGTELEWLASLKSADTTIEDLYAFYLESNPDCTMEEFIDLFTGAGRDPIQDAAQKALRSVVSVQARFSNIAPGTSEGSGGSGVIYQTDDETGVSYIITNYHVIYNNSAVPRISANIQVAPYGKEYFPSLGADFTTSVKATFVGGSISKDIAVLKTDANQVFNNGVYCPITVADSNQVKVGEPAIAAGNPENGGISVTSGIVNVESEMIPMAKLSNPTDTELHRVMRVDTAINQGNSGGGLYNKKGELIGIVNAKSIELEIDNIGYAIPSNVAIGIARNVVEGVRHGSSFVKYRIGLETKITGSWAELDDGIMRIHEEVTVEGVTIGLPAASAPAAQRIKTGDVVISAQLVTAEGINRAPKIDILRNFMLSDYLFYAREGDTLKLVVMRDGEEVECSMTISPDYYTLLEQL